MRRTTTIFLPALLAWATTGCVQTGDEGEREGAALAAEPDDDERPDGFAAPSDDEAALCQEHVAGTLVTSWPTVERGEDLLTDGALPFLVTSEMDETKTLALELRIVGEGEHLTVPISPVTLAAGERRELELAIPGEVLAKLARFGTSAQLHVATTIPMVGEAPLGPFLSDALYLHVEGDQLVVYDEDGLRTRHQAGDLRGDAYRTMTSEQRRDVVAIGVARLERVAEPPTATEHDAAHEGRAVP